ncbi:hypothetical protein SLEP1_g29601 [Rubroshorea leprosula]|uniref:Uncharacterized protein n=1 Tax=Rubroshorea leprosula TaxID=152421 RepID=A0AAV5K7Z9_9ROSI|nr:hypothetical protein SLEP1_g29601 [Rubroshorea leprosula]
MSNIEEESSEAETPKTSIKRSRILSISQQDILQQWRNHLQIRIGLRVVFCILGCASVGLALAFLFSPKSFLFSALHFPSLSITFSDFNFKALKMSTVFSPAQSLASKSLTNLLIQNHPFGSSWFYFLQIYAKRVALALEINRYLTFGDLSD